MSVKASIVVSFSGEGILIAELDDILNNDNSSFKPGDDIYIGIYRHPTNVIVSNPLPSSGQCDFQYTVTRSVTEQLWFTDSGTLSLLYPVFSGFFVTRWYGKEGQNISTEGQQVSIDSGWPCIADVSYTVSLDVWKLIPPVVDFSTIEVWPITVLIEGSYYGS